MDLFPFHIPIWYFPFQSIVFIYEEYLLFLVMLQTYLGF